MMTQNQCQNILMIYIEPTPYILGLIETLKQYWEGKIDVLFLSENNSQNWNIQCKNKYKVLSKNSIKKMYQLVSQLSQKKYDCVHVAGWGSISLILLIAISKFKKLFVTIESDTPIPHYTKPWKQIIKRLFYPIIFRLVDLFLPGGKRQAKYIENFGVNSEYIYPVNMTVDVTSIKQYAATLSYDDRLMLRQRYKISEHDVVFLYVGRLETYKGIKDLITSFSHINNESARLL